MRLMNSMISVKQMILFIGGAVILSVVVNKAPVMWSFIQPWLKPPYLLIVINGIIAAIVVASRFCRSQSAAPVRSQRLISAMTPPPPYYESYSYPPEVRSAAAAAGYEDRVVELRPVTVNGWKVDADAEDDVDEGVNGFGDRDLTSDTPSPERDPPEFRLEYFRPADLTENVPAIERERKPETPRKKKTEGTSAAPHGGLRSGKSAADPFRRNTRKSNSFRDRSVYNDSTPSRSATRRKESPSRRVEAQEVSMDRSLTFNSRSSAIFSPELEADYLLPANSIRNINQRDMIELALPTEEECETLESAWKRITEGSTRAAPPESDRYDDSAASRASSGIRIDASPSQDELNRRFEAFIKKVNDDMRCERQKSLDQYIHLNSAA